MAIFCNGSLPFFGYYMIWRPYPLQAPEWAQSLIINLSFYLTPIFLIVGTIGNVLSIIVFLRPAMSSLASKSRFILISIMDIIILYGCLFTMDLTINDLTAFCNIELEAANIWIQSSLVMTDSWVLGLVTLERTLAIFRPLSTWTSNEKRKRCCSWINLILIAVPFVSLFLNLPSLFGPILEMTVMAQFYHVIVNVNTIISVAVPFVLILCLDIAILFKLYGLPFSGFKNEGEKTKRKRSNGWLSRKKMRRALKKRTEIPAGNNEDDVEADGNGNQNYKKNTGSEKMPGNSHVSVGKKSARSRALQSIKMMLALDIVAILLNTPIIVVIISETNAMTYVYFARLIFYTRHVINFFVYFISSQFQRETIAVLRCCCYCFRRPSTPDGTSTTSVSTITSKIEM